MIRMVLAVAVFVALVGRSQIGSAEPNKNCMKDCAASYQACMSQIDSKDAEKTKERARACSERMNDCQKSCQ